MRNSPVSFKQLLRVALLALPVLLLLGLNGRTVTVWRTAPPAGRQVSAAPRGTVIKQRVMLEAASPLAHYVAPAALGWLPAALPTGWPARLLRRAVATATPAVPQAFVALLHQQRLLAAGRWAQAP